MSLDADSEAAETIKQAQSERAKGIKNLQDQLKEAKIMQGWLFRSFLNFRKFHIMANYLSRIRPRNWVSFRKYARTIDRVRD